MDSTSPEWTEAHQVASEPSEREAMLAKAQQAWNVIQAIPVEDALTPRGAELWLAAIADALQRERDVAERECQDKARLDWLDNPRAEHDRISECVEIYWKSGVDSFRHAIDELRRRRAEGEWGTDRTDVVLCRCGADFEACRRNQQHNGVHLIAVAGE